MQGWQFSMFFLYSSYIRPICVLYKSYINPLEVVVFIGLGRGEFVGFAIEKEGLMVCKMFKLFNKSLSISN